MVWARRPINLSAVFSGVHDLSSFSNVKMKITIGPRVYLAVVKVVQAPWRYNKFMTSHEIFFISMKLAIYRFGLFLFIAVLLPRALPGGLHEMTSAVLRRSEPLRADGDNPVPQNHEQDQKPRQDQQQGERMVVRFIREPDPAPEFAVASTGAR
jgi:hypothetical protein